jgi:outer membrane protein assembly factor BamB
VGTGNPGNTCAPPSAGATKYPDGILGLDLATGKFKSYFQAISNDTTDADFGTAPVLHQTQALNQCTGDDQILFWVTLAGKNGDLLIAPRGSTGLLSDPTVLRPGHQGIIGAQLILPSTETQACGGGNLQLAQTGAEIFIPLQATYLVSLPQSADGSVGTQQNISYPSCPGGDFCLNWSSLAAIGNVTFFGAGDNHLYAATTTNSLVWNFPTHGPVISSPAISHGAVYMADANGFVYCLTLGGQ